MQRDTYERIYRAVYSRRWLVTLLSVISTVICAFIAILYAAALTGMLIADTVVGLRLLAVTATPFLLVTLVRHLINSPRPYEVLDLPELDCLRKKGRVGHSFPSRHVASAMIIGGAIIPFSLPFGVLTVIFGVALGACRVLSGRHFLRDVLAGGAIGAVAGAVGALIVNI